MDVEAEAGGSASAVSTQTQHVVEEPANLSYAVRGMPMLNRCPNAHGGNDCGFKVSRPATE